MVIGYSFSVGVSHGCAYGDVVLKVIFLDIDGVLNTYDLVRSYGFDYIDRSLVALLATVVRDAGAEIVLSSFWRLHPKDRFLVDSALKEFGMFVCDKTPSLPGLRANEIASWLDANTQVEKYAILDDTDDAGVGFEHSFFQTSAEIGLTSEIASKVTFHLNRY